VCSVSGTVFACNDTGLTPTTAYSYTVEARIGSTWTSGESPTVSATTAEQPTYVVSVPSGARTAGTAFTVTLRATTNGTTTDTSYTGAHAVTFSGPGTSPLGTDPTYPSTVNFVAGVGTASITLVRAETATLQATDGTRTGSVPVTVVAGGPSRLRFVDAACTGGTVVVGNGGTFASHVGVSDANGNPTATTALLNIVLSRNPNAGTLSTNLLVLALGDTQTGGFSYTRVNGNGPDITLTASAIGFTSASCIVAND
jgi:hypothetical protein